MSRMGPYELDVDVVRDVTEGCSTLSAVLQVLGGDVVLIKEKC
jgi:hypothetical protein